MKSKTSGIDDDFVAPPPPRTRENAGAEPDAALEDFLQAHGSHVLRYIETLLPADVRKLHDPMDVLQDVCLQAFCIADDCPVSDRTAALRWVKTIARRRVVTLTRRRMAIKNGGPGGGAVKVPRHRSVVAMLEDLTAFCRTPSKSAAAHEFTRALEEALGRLPAPYALVIRLRHMEGLSNREAAQHMGRTEKAVENLCSRALDALRLELGPQSSI